MVIRANPDQRPIPIKGRVPHFCFLRNSGIDVA